MIDEPDPLRKRLEEAIEAYLARSPHAADTTKGIAEWWISELAGSATLGDVDGALEALVRRGVVDRTRLPDGTEIFRATGPHRPP